MRRAVRRWAWGCAGLLLAMAPAARAQVSHEELNARMPFALGGSLAVDLYEPYTVYANSVPLRGVMRLHALTLTADKDGEWGGAHAELRARDAKPRRFYSSNVWLEEAYLYGRLGQSVFKAGSVKHQIGLPDETLYGTILEHDGISNDADYGISAEGTVRYGDHLTFTRALQYFISENGINRAFDDSLGVWKRDGESSQSAHEQRGWFLRAAPEWTRGNLAVAPGVTASTQRVELDRGGSVREPHETVMWGGDLRVRAGHGMRRVQVAAQVLGRNARGWAEYDWRAVPFTYANVRYTDASLTLGSDAAWLRYGYARKTFRRAGTHEAQHQIGLHIPMGKTASLAGEYVIYRQFTPSTRTTLERALLLRATAGF